MKADKRQRERNQRLKGADLHALVHEAFPAGIDDGGGAATVGIARGKGGKGLAEVGMEGGCGFDFDGVEVPFAPFDEIDFDPVGIAVEIEVGLDTQGSVLCNSGS